jgi:hypothetical protein
MNEIYTLFALIFIFGLLLGALIGHEEQSFIQLKTYERLLNRLKPESLLDIQRVDNELSVEALESKLKKRFFTLLLVLFGVSMIGCAPSNEKALSVLTGAGYTEVKLGGFPFFSCSEDDDFNVSFVGVGPSGVKVTGAVCCGLLKNCTIRLD